MRYTTLLAAIMFLAPFSAGAKTVLRTIDEMNRTPHAINSHAGAESRSSLEMEHNTKQLIPNEQLDIRGGAVYSRIKQLQNGQWLMLFHGYHIGSYIYCCLSDDLKSWSYRNVLFRPYPVTHKLGDDQRRFSTADAVVLHNGDIVVVCSYRANKGYAHGVDCGIMMRRSSDNGKTWSEERVIYEGANWEPYLLQLPDGRLQCYFTDSNHQISNSGTSVILSCDNGLTWSSKAIVCRQHRYTYPDGTRIYTDQMPSFRLLNDGCTLLGFVESNNAVPKEKGDYRMSVVRQHGTDWTPLSGEEVGPADRDTNVIKGAGGYVSTFPSGETVLSCNINNRFSLKVGNHTGTQFNGASWQEGWLKPFHGYWGSTERMDSHRLLATVHCKRGIQYVIYHLNHDIAAPYQATKLDGRNDEWLHDEALFVGSDSPSQAIIRAAHDATHLYLLVECKSDDEEASLEVGIGSLPKFTVSRYGLHCERALRGTVKFKCHKARSVNGERGFIAEVAIPLASLDSGVHSLPVGLSLSAHGKCDTITSTPNIRF